MGYAILGFLGFIVAFTLMVYSANVITSKYVTRILDARFTSMEQIVNDKRVPEAWLHPFRQRLTSARRNGGSDAKLARLGRQTQKRCLRKLEAMIRYATEANFTDTRSTKNIVTTTLKAQRDVWETMDWSAWIDLLDAPETPPAEQGSGSVAE